MSSDGVVVARFLVVLLSISAQGRQQDTTVTKCCPMGELYSAGFESCKKVPISNPSSDPTSQSGDTFGVTLAPNVSIAHELIPCLDGFVASISTDFHLYDNGSVSIPSRGLLRRNEKFCIGDMQTQNPFKPYQQVVRFCVPDPCIGTNCIRKCCPKGMAINMAARTCEESTIPFVFTPYPENGLSLSRDESVVHFRFGVVPKCLYGLDVYIGNVTGNSAFHILDNGSLYVREIDSVEEQYCIDNVLQVDDTAYLEAIALICALPPPEEILHVRIYPYFLLTSTAFLVVTFVVYAVTPEIRNIHGISIMSHVASLTVTYIGLATLQFNPVMSDALCIASAILIHYAFLSTFTWLNVMSFDIWWTFSNLRPTIRSRNQRVAHTGRRLIFYSIYGWGVPLVFVITGVIVDKVAYSDSSLIRPMFGEKKCWFGDDKSLLTYLYGPMAVLITSNIIFFVLTIVLLHRATMDASMATGRRRTKQKFRVIVSLSVLMGVSWMTEIISFACGGDAAEWIFTDILNILTGVFIFFIFVCKPNVWKLLKIRFPFLRPLDACCPSCIKVGKASISKQGSSTRPETDSTSNNRSCKMENVTNSQES